MLLKGGRSLWIVTLLILVLSVVFFVKRNGGSGKEAQASPARETRPDAPPRSAPDARPADAGGSPAARGDEPKPQGTDDQAGRFRRSDRGKAVDRTKLPVVNVEAGMDETPPWPDGPRVMAEVATESKRYINLRPNDLGIMPTLNIGANESMVIRLNFPDNSPGDSIYVELADGGVFGDSDKAGQVRKLGDVKTLEIPLSADERVGILKLLVRQNGHTRVLPFWVGPPQPIAGSSL